MIAHSTFKAYNKAVQSSWSIINKGFFAECDRDTSTSEDEWACQKMRIKDEMVVNYKDCYSIYEVYRPWILINFTDKICAEKSFFLCSKFLS